MNRRHDGDRGAVTALVAVLLAGGVLLGMSAFALDVGTMYSERAQLLNGANAAALAAAEECSHPGGRCFGGPTATMLDVNAADGVSSLDGICGRDVSRGFSVGCPGATSGPPGTRCVAPAPAALSYVEVRAGTETPDGRNVLPPVFAGTMVPGYSDGHITACARVAWGTPAGPYAGLALSFCRFQQITGGVYAPRSGGFSFPPPYVPSAGVEQILPLQDSLPDRRVDSCGDLGYVNSTGSCQVNASQGTSLTGLIASDDARHRVTGAACQAVAGAKSPPTAGDPYPYLLMPIYTNVVSDDSSTGAATFTSIYGIAAFVVTGYKLSNGAGSVDWLLGFRPNSSSYCGAGSGGQAQCLRGYFVSVDIIDGHAPQAGWTHNLGVNVFKTAG